MSNKNSVVAIYKTYYEAEETVKEFQKSGFCMKNISIIGKDYHAVKYVVGYYNTGDHARYWGKLGGFWGGLWGELAGAAFVSIPGTGPVLVGGPLAASIVANLEGAAITGGLDALEEGLCSLGIPKNSIVNNISAVKSGLFLLIAHGSEEVVESAKLIIKTVGTSDFAIHLQENFQSSVSLL